MTGRDRFVSSAALRDHLLDAEGRQKEEVEREGALAYLLGLIPQELDLVQLGLDAVGEPFELGAGRAASYDRTTGDLYIRDDLADVASFDEVGIFDEFEIVVAYTAALLQQHFDVGALRRAAESDLDRRAAVEALVIGDANTVGQEYMAAHISPDRFASAPLPVRGRTIENSPEFVRRRALFAPQGGTNFIAALRRTGQWDSMRLVYKNPPASTEQIIHPDRYLEGDEPVAVTLPDLASVLGSKWAEIYSGVLGESFLKAYLSQWSEGDSDEAANGWGGDRFSLLEGPSGERVLVGLLVWDTVGDANQFLDLVSGITHPSGRARLSANQERVLVILGDENAADAIATRFTDF